MYALRQISGSYLMQQNVLCNDSIQSWLELETQIWWSYSYVNVTTSENQWTLDSFWNCEVFLTHDIVKKLRLNDVLIRPLRSLGEVKTLHGKYGRYLMTHVRQNEYQHNCQWSTQRSIYQERTKYLEYTINIQYPKAELKCINLFICTGDCERDYSHLHAVDRSLTHWPTSIIYP